MAATIKDIARKLNISTSTVSYALNGGPRPVPEEVRERVLQTARDLGYRPNRLARSMVTRRTHTYGVVPTEASENLAVSPYFQMVLNGILNASEKVHQDVLIFTRYDQQQVESLADTVMDGRVDGLIFLSPPANNPIFDLISAANFPFVVTNSQREGATCLLVDNRHGVRLALEHLHALGHRRIGMVYGLLWLVDGAERLTAFRSIAQELGMETRADWEFDGAFTQRGGAEAFAWYQSLANPPTALFFANDEMASGFAWRAQASEFPLPERLSIVGFDNSPLADYTRPGLTTVQQPLDQIGEAAVSALGQIIAGEDAPSQTFLTRLIERASTASPLEDMNTHDQSATRIHTH